MSIAAAGEASRRAPVDGRVAATIVPCLLELAFRFEHDTSYVVRRFLSIGRASEFAGHHTVD